MPTMKKGRYERPDKDAGMTKSAKSNNQQVYTFVLTSVIISTSRRCHFIIRNG